MDGVVEPSESTKGWKGLKGFDKGRGGERDGQRCKGAARM